MLRAALVPAPVAEKTTVCVSVVGCRPPAVGGGVLQAATTKAEAIRGTSTRVRAIARLNSAQVMRHFGRPSQAGLSHPIVPGHPRDWASSLRTVKLESLAAFQTGARPVRHRWSDFRTHAAKEGGTCCLTERGTQLLQASIGRIRFAPPCAALTPSTTERGTLLSCSLGVVS